jgi:hypothetical protein
MVFSPTEKVRMDLWWKENLVEMEIMPWDYFMAIGQHGVVIWRSFKGGFIMVNIGYQIDIK